jgi:uncharacterized membrane protein
MALASLGVLIYFIHHAAVSIQAPEVIAMVAADLMTGIDRLFPEALGKAASPDDHDLTPEVVREFGRQAQAIFCTATGYLQSIDNDRLVALAAANQLVVLLPCRPGDFMVEGNVLIEVKPRVDEEVADKVRSCFIFGDDRTHLQDVQFTIHQLVEVAVRALSPGINDPITAINCIERLAAALCRLAQRSMPSAYRFDDQGQLRILVGKPVRFKELVDSSFDMIRQYGRSSTAVTLRLLDAVILIGERVRREEDRAALSAQAIMIDRGSRDGVLEERDRQEVKERFGRAMLALQGRS